MMNRFTIYFLIVNRFTAFFKNRELVHNQNAKGGIASWGLSGFCEPVHNPLFFPKAL
jgi:hypothetical protein